MKKKFFCICIFLGALISLQAQQDNRSNIDGWHLGIVGEGNIAQRMSVSPLTATPLSTIVPKAHPALGWKAGIEASYHFAHYFGFSVGIHFGSVSQMELGYVHNGAYEKPYASFRDSRIQIPIKFEFHSRLGNSHFLFYSAIGVNVNNVVEAIATKADENRNQKLTGDKGTAGHDYCWTVTWLDEDDNMSFRSEIQDKHGHQVNASALFDLGFYYELPYGDLIRTGLAANLAFRDRFTGFYDSYDNGLHSNGALSYRHNTIGLEFSYIHCFRNKAQRERKTNK